MTAAPSGEGLEATLRNALDMLRVYVDKEGLRWIEPHICHWSDPEGEPFAEWFGDTSRKPDRPEPGRMVLHFVDGKLESFASDSSSNALGVNHGDALTNYRAYLKVNGWLK